MIGNIQNDKRASVCALVYASLLAFFIVFGYSFYNTNTIETFCSSIPDFLRNIGVILILILVFFIVCLYLFTHKFSFESKFVEYHSCFFPLLAILFFLCYIPAFLAYYPGIWSYDINYQIYQITPGPYTTYHPPLQTYCLELCIRACNFDFAHAITLYVSVQMVLLAVACSSAVCSLIKNRVPRLLIVISIIYLALNPVIAIFSQIPVKDVLCGIVFIPMMVKVAFLAISPDSFLASKKDCLEFALWTLLFCLFRNNAVYAVLVAVPFFCIVFPKNRLKVAICLSIPLALYFVTVFLIYPALNVEKAHNFNVLCVPLQQIANVVTNAEDSLTESDIETINKFLPFDDIATTYNPRFADPITAIYDGSYGVLYVLRIWLKLLPTHLKEYINAFLALSTPLWYPLASAVDPFSGVVYIETNVKYHIGSPFINAGLAPRLLSFYELVGDYSLFEPLPKFMNIFSLCFPIWFILFCFFKVFARHSLQKCSFFVIPILFWATFLFGPVSNSRYVLPLMMTYPLYLSYSSLPPNNRLRVENC